MACLKPLPAMYAGGLTRKGKSPVAVFPRGTVLSDGSFFVPCGQCLGCRLARSAQWAVRCHHEASLYEANSFVTLTFSPEELMKRLNPWSLDKRDHQLFLKRLRNHLIDPYSKWFVSEDFKVRFFMCGEYGDKTLRPHYHFLLFGYDFPDKKFFKKAPDGSPLYVSEFLNELWPYGHHMIGAVTFKSSAYVARYCMKKMTGKLADSHYDGRLPEYACMSLKPGIGKAWFDRFKDEIFLEDRDCVIVNGVKHRIPRFYDSQFELLDLSLIHI